MKPTTEKDYKRRILKVLLHIQNHLGETLSLDDLARVAAFSPFHFHRIFRGMVGESVKEHIRRLRLERAAHKLKLGTEPITTIALDSGYEALESFTRAFRSMFGASPSEFRKSRRTEAAAAPGAPSGIHYREGAEASLDDDLDFQPASDRPGGTPPGEPLEVALVERAPLRVLFVRHVGPYSECGGAWQKLFGYAFPRGLVGPTAAMIGLVHDDPDVTPPDRVRYDACLIVPPTYEHPETADGDTAMQEIPGGLFAQATHRGPYDRLGQTYSSLCGGWMPGSGYEPAARPAYECYKNSPMTTAPDDLVTDIFIPVEGNGPGPTRS